MKTKRVLIIALTAVLGGGILWVATAQPSGKSERGKRENAPRSATIYACPMHPSVKADQPGDCPICGMALRRVNGDTAGTNAPPAAAQTNGPAAVPGCCSPGGGCR